jgi:hypothetical protein
MVALRRLDGVDGVDDGLRFTDGMVAELVGGAVSWKERGQESRKSKGKEGVSLALITGY